MNLIVTTILYYKDDEYWSAMVEWGAGVVVEGWSECYNDDDDGNSGCWSAMVRGVGRVV